MSAFSQVWWNRVDLLSRHIGSIHNYRVLEPLSGPGWFFIFYNGLACEGPCKWWILVFFLQWDCIDCHFMEYGISMYKWFIRFFDGCRLSVSLVQVDQFPSPLKRTAVALLTKGLVQTALSSRVSDVVWMSLVVPENTGHRRLSSFDRAPRMFRYKKSNFSNLSEDLTLLYITVPFSWDCKITITRAKMATLFGGSSFLLPAWYRPSR